MPVNGFTVGRDVVVTIVGANGQVLRFPIMTGFDAKQINQDIKSIGMDGNARYGELPVGWQGTIDVDRQSADMDDYFADMESRYYAGQNIPTATITETIEEADGSLSQYRYTGVVFKFDEPGPKKGDSKITQKVSFMASRRLKVA